MVMLLKHLRYDVISEALAGEAVCGDQYLVKQLNDSILIAVADGLGHGPEAAFAAKKAMNILDTYANESIETLVQICDRELQETRGVALTLARISENNMLTYIAIGNVTGVCWLRDEAASWRKQSLLPQGGIVGSQLYSLQLNNITLNPGDFFILATDGIKGKFEIDTPKLESAKDLAARLFKTYRNSKDDGLILVAKLL